MLAPILLTLSLGAAEAAGNGSELTFQWGQLGAPDEHWGLFSDRDAVHSLGLRAGYGITPHLGVVASWQHSVDGGTVWAGGYDYEGDESSFNLALASNRFSLGPKARFEVFPWLVPYATVQGALLWGSVKLDDDLDDDENLNQIRESGLAPGALGALGLEFVFRRSDRAVRPALGFEAGYGWMAPLTLEPMGELEFHGFYGSGTLGLRF